MDEFNSNLGIEELANKFNETGVPAEDNDIMVVGVGGGGGNAVNHMFRQSNRDSRVTYVVCNTDEMAIAESPVPNKVIIGDGRGAGNVPEKARKFAEDDIDKINKIFDAKAKMVFITAGMGGGTGTGAAPVVARVARERGLLTIGIVTIPFLFEGKKKILKALDGAEEMAKYVDALLIINNERLAEIYPDLDFFNAFGKADDTLSTAARSISEIITIRGYINLDFNDVDTTLRDGGTAIISTGYGEGEGRVTKAIQAALNSPLLKNRDINGSKKLLLNLYMSTAEDGNSISMAEISELRDFVSSIDAEVDVIWGAAVDDSLGKKVKITILAAGFDITIREEEEEDFKIVKKAPAATVVKADPVKTPDIEERLAEHYPGMSKYIILPHDALDDDAAIEAIEKNPAYNRDSKIVEQFKKGHPAGGPENSSSDGGSSGGQINFM